MRDKWDREQNGSTYGVITMTNAISNCQSFYDPKSGWEQKVIGFQVLIDSIITGVAGVNSVAGSDSLSERLLNEDALLAAAWAMRYDIVKTLEKW